MQVWPQSAVSPSFTRDLGGSFPQVLVIYNPYSQRWQAYEAPKGSDWDARRLVNAIAAHHETVARDETDRWEWWRAPGAPRIFEVNLAREPGDWFIQYLRQNDHWARGGAKKFIAEVEDRERRKAEATQRERHDHNRGVADDTWKFYRDALPSGQSRTDAMKEIRRRENRPEIVG